MSYVIRKAAISLPETWEVPEVPDEVTRPRFLNHGTKWGWRRGGVTPVGTETLPKMWRPRGGLGGARLAAGMRAGGRPRRAGLHNCCRKSHGNAFPPDHVSPTDVRGTKRSGDDA